MTNGLTYTILGIREVCVMTQKSPLRPKTRTRGRLLSLFRTAPAMLFSSKVPFRMKALFAGAVLLYWVLPDLMPFMPIDDMLFTLIVIPWFSNRAAKYDSVGR